jgi:hypothetical protein
MNILEHYIVEIHSVTPYEADWTSEFPDRKFVQVDMTHDCYGQVLRNTHVFNTKEWEQIKSQGYYMG